MFQMVYQLEFDEWYDMVNYIVNVKWFVIQFAICICIYITMEILGMIECEMVRNLVWIHCVHLLMLMLH